MIQDELDRIEKLIAIIAIGISVSLKNGAISINEAEQLLYSPKVFELLKIVNADDRIQSIVFSGTELEDIARLIPENLNKELSLIIEDSISFLSCKNEINLTLPKWYNSLFLGFN